MSDIAVNAESPSLEARSKETFSVSSSAAESILAHRTCLAGALTKEIACPICHVAELVWAFQVQGPEFKSGGLVCQHCKKMFDVTPR